MGDLGVNWRVKLKMIRGLDWTALFQDRKRSMALPRAVMNRLVP